MSLGAAAVLLLASQVWDALQPLDCPEQLKAAGHLQNQQLKQHTAALRALDCVGPVLQSSSVAKVVLQVARLRQWQQQGSAASAGTGKAPAAAAAVASLSKQMAGLDLLAEEFGAGLNVAVADGPAAMSWFLRSSSSSHTSASGQGQQNGHLSSAAAVGDGVAGVAATPAELRQLFATEAAADDLGWGGDAAEKELDADVDIDSDDERKGRGRKVSVQQYMLCNFVVSAYYVECGLAAELVLDSAEGLSRYRQ